MQFFPRTSLSFILPAPTLLPLPQPSPCIYYQFKLEFLIQKHKHDFSLILIMEVARQQAFPLALYFHSLASRKIAWLCHPPQAFSAPTPPCDSAFQRQQGRGLTREMIELMPLKN